MTLLSKKHIDYVVNLNSEMSKQSYEHWLSEHLRMNGLYWGIMTLVTLKSLDSLPRQSIIDFVLSCVDKRSGGFGAYPQHDGHILSTLSAVQILSILGALDELDKESVIKFTKNLQLPNGSFQGDSFGETDTRFVYTALSILSILEGLEEELVNKSLDYLKQCENFDGAYGMRPGAESHGAQVFTVIASFAICNRLDLVNDKLSSWLSERQVKNGGLNGRPEKLPDVCYSWWILSPLAILKKLKWIDLSKLEQFILDCQDDEGGVSDRKGNQTDVYHTCFSLTGLSIINDELYEGNKYDMDSIDPVYCMPYSATKTFKPWPYKS
ncbi:geranylgeranyl transferase type-2 subunit beta [[Candida] jaroonii]|uniref:Geranylgeranyl transferase type-2 subunit beta n=1 Tax=[Candida] jaroonii TaxID=467808 RepID=A0ACA9YBG1_9ASCO|nr:geranylgeranyl transferase type-2 subunit beta [[Candida] jaroonii]